MYTISTIILLFGLGYVKEWSNKDIIVGIIFLCCYLFSRGHRILLITLLVSFSTLAFYFPTGLIYGKPTSEILIPLLQTNRLEIIGYLLAIKYKILLSIIFILIQLIIYSLSKKLIVKKNLNTLILFIFFYILSLFGVSINHAKLNEGAFLKNIIAASKIIYRQKEELKKNIGNSKNIQINMIDIYDNTEIRIVIIGESVRRDYMSVYGYPLNTTPYLNSAKGIFIDGLVSAGPATEPSLTRMLFKTIPEKNKIDWGANVISLANKAGYETYWISNQGKDGFAGENTFLALSNLATQSNFTKEGDFSSTTLDDEEMLPTLKKVINDNSNSKVIFIHMAGSHEPVCSRLGNFEPNFKIYNEADCYIATIEKLDLFIKKVTDTLKGKRYKLMYFSDHGLSVEKKEVYHDVELYQEYQVPLFYLDSEAKEHLNIKKVISGLNLIDLYSSFINIKTNITDEKYSFPMVSKLEDNVDPLIYWQKYKHLSSLNKKQLPITDTSSNSIVPNVIELKNNYEYSNKCMTGIDFTGQAFPYNPSIYKISGWASMSGEIKQQLPGQIGTFIVDDKKILYAEGERESREDLIIHFKLSKNPSNYLGIASLIDKKYIKSNQKFYFGYKDQMNKYIICNN
ncbi:phosphoethanolamine transferase [Snodgrassella gandavensis]|uniref:phosphoethanolamine transferase n=1 Tax=Snodgrassella gandavensis TaxID=2946698 RepID=UPI001EF5CB09|nr:phosphoethanolamine transferase [Snodgrassella gandavensis]